MYVPVVFSSGFLFSPVAPGCFGKAVGFAFVVLLAFGSDEVPSPGEGGGGGGGDGDGGCGGNGVF